MKSFRSCLTGALAIFLAAGAPAETILPPVHPLDEVEISTQVPMAYAAAGTPGSFLIQRVGDGVDAVTVTYMVSGKAVAGQDYRPLKGTRILPAGKEQVTILVHPLAVAGSGGTVRGVRVTLLPGDGYSLDSAVKATVKIVQ